MRTNDRRGLRTKPRITPRAPAPATPGHMRRPPPAVARSRPGTPASPAPASSMRFWVLSDLHVDDPGLPSFDLPAQAPDCDAVLVAGGIASSLDTTLHWLDRAVRRRCGDRPIVMVPGNREFWNGVPMAETLARGRELARDLGITLLSDETCSLRDRHGYGIHVVGATLWTDWALNGLRRATVARGFARGSWPDCRNIVLTRRRAWSPQAAAGAHARSRAVIEDTLGNIVCQEHGIRASPVALITGVRRGDKAVVLTHHAPSRRSLPDDWIGWLSTEKWLPAAQASDLESIMTMWGAPALWVHGHVATHADYKVGRTRVVANPRGLPIENGSFDPALVVEI